ncbi:MAG: site-specific integrase [Planctomycetota bacterium]
MPAIVISLVQSKVSKIKSPSTGRQLYRDATLNNFGLEVLAGGTMTFYRLGRILGQVTKFKLGNYPNIAVDLAREQCVKVNGLIAQGIDPRKKAKSTVKTLGDLWLWHYTHMVKGKIADEKKMLSLWDRVFTPWAKLGLDEIDRAMCVELQTKIRTTIGKTAKGHRTGGPGAANHAIDLLRSLYRTAHLNRWCDERDSPVRTIKKDHIRARDRFLQPSELQVFFDKLKLCTDVMQDVFKLALFTGVRRSNVCAARKVDVDLVNEIWTIPWAESKNRDPIRIRLIPQATEIFLARLDNRSEWFFPSWGKTGHLVDPKRQWHNLLERAELDDLRIHDLRRTIASWQAGAGTSLHIIAQSLGQNNMKTTPIYARLQDSVVRNAVHNAALLILDAAAEKKPENMESHLADTQQSLAGDTADTPS